MEYDDNFLAFCIYNDPGNNNRAWHHLAELAKIIFELKGIDPTKVEYEVGNYQGTGKDAILMDNKFVRFSEN